MTIAATILKAFRPDEALTNAEIQSRTGFGVTRVATYLARLRDRGLIERVDDSAWPLQYRLAGAARTKALALAAGPQPHESDGSIVGNAKRTPRSVFDLGRCA